MTQDLYYYESGYIDDSYFVYTADAESLIECSSSITCDATVIVQNFVNFAADVSSTSSLDAVIGKLVSIALKTRTPQTLSYTTATLSSTKSKFGGSSLRTLADVTSVSDDYKFGTGDFTIEFWAARDNTSTQPFLDMRPPTNDTSINSLDLTLGGYMLYGRDTGTSINWVAASPTITTTGELVHFAVVRYQGVIKVYANGSAGAPYTDTRNFNSPYLRIGGYYNTTSTTAQGYIDELRISKGIARYTSNFTVPSSPFEDDDYTVLLAHFNTDISDDATAAGSGLRFTSSLTNELTVSKLGDAALTSSLDLTAIADKFLGSAVELQTTASLGAVVSIIQSTEVALTVICNTNISPNTIKGAVIALESQFTSSATISHIHGADLFAIGDAALALEVSRIRDNNIDVSSVFSSAIDGTRGIYVSAQADSAFEFAIDNLWVRQTEAAFDAAFSSYCDPTVIGGGITYDAEASLESSTSLVADNEKISFADSAITSAFELSAAISKTLEFNSELQVASSVTATISHIEGADLIALTSSNLDASADRIRETNASLESNLSVTYATEVIRSADSALASESNLDSLVTKFAGLDATLTVETSTNALLGIIKEFDSTENAAFAPSLTVSVFKNSIAVLESTSSLASSAVVIRGAQSQHESQTSVTASLNQIKQGSAESTAAFVVSAAITVNKVYMYQRIYQTPNSGANSRFITNDITLDSNKNLYTVGYDNYLTASPYYSARISKFNQYNELQWSKSLTQSTQFDFERVIVDSSNNVYAIGKDSIANPDNLIAVKYDTNGTILWQKRISYGLGIDIADVVIDSSNNLYIGGTWDNTVGTQGYIAKINSSGVHQWTNRTPSVVRSLSSNGTSIYAVVSSYSVASVFYKLDSSGGVTWAKTISTSVIGTKTFYSAPIVIASNGDLIVAIGYYNSTTTTYHTHIAKFNASGTLLSSAGYTDAFVESMSLVNDTIYGISNSGSNRDILKISSSNLSIELRKRINGVSILPLVASDSYFVTSGTQAVPNTTTDYYGVNFKLPLDGSGILEDLSYPYISVLTRLTQTISSSTSSPSFIGLTPTIVDTTITSSDRTNTLTVTNYQVNPGAYLQQATASLSSTSTVSAVALRTVKATASLVSSSSVQLQVEGVIKETSATLSANGFAITVISRIRPEVAALDSTFVLTASGTKIKNANASLSSNFAVSASALDLDFAQAALTSQFAVNANASSIKRITKGLASTATQTVTVRRLRFGATSVSSQFTASITATKFKTITAALSSQFRIDKAQPQRYAPRPNGTWDSSIAPQPKWASWNRLRVTVAIAPSSLTSGFTHTLLSWNGHYIKRIYSVGPTRNYLDIDGAVYDISGITPATGVLLVNIDITRGQAFSVLGHAAPSPWDFDGSLGPIVAMSSSTIGDQSANANLLLTRTGFSNASILSTDPYVLDDQTYVLGLYDAWGSPDRIDILGTLAGNLTANFTQSTTAIGFSNARANLVTSSAVQTNAVKNTVNQLQLASNLTVSSQPLRIKQLSASLSSNFSQVTQVKKTTRYSAALTVSSTVVAPPYNFTKATANLTANTTASLTALRIKQIAANFDAFVTELAVINRIGNGLIHLDSTASLTADVIKSTETFPNLVSTASLNATATTVVDFSAVLEVTSSSTVQVKKTTRYSASLDSTTEQTTNARKDVVNSAVLSTTTSLSCQPYYLYIDNIQLVMNTSQTSVVRKITDVQAPLEAFASELVYNDTIRYAEAHLVAFNTVLATSRIFTVDPYYQIKIASETRGLRIKPEVRTLTPAQENRYLVVREETRLLGIKSETRVNKIKGSLA